MPEVKIILSEVQASKKKTGISLEQIKELLKEPLTLKEVVSKLSELTSKSNACALLSKEGLLPDEIGCKLALFEYAT